MTSTDEGAGTARSLAPHEAIAALGKLYLQINRVRPGSVHERLATLFFGDLEKWVHGGKVANQQTGYQLRELAEIVDAAPKKRVLEKAVENNVSQTLRRLAAGIARFGHRDRRTSGEHHEDACEITGRAERIRNEAAWGDPVREAIEVGINVERCTLAIDGAWKVVHILGPTALLRGDDDPRYWLDVRFEPSNRADPAPPARVSSEAGGTALAFSRTHKTLAAERDAYLRTLTDVLRPRTRYGEAPELFIDRYVAVSLDAATAIAPRAGVFRTVPRTSWKSVRRGIGSAIISGNAGEGKTWLLRQEAIAYAQDALASPDAPIPIHVSLHDVPALSAQQSFLDRVVNSAHGIATRSTAFVDYLKDRIDSGNAIILFDDLDEIPTGRRHLLENELRTVIVDMQPRVLIACRSSAYDDTLPLPELKLVGFKQAEIERYIGERLDINPAARDRALRALASPPILEFCRNPLLLSLLCFVAERREELPHTRAGLYVEFLAVLLRSGWRDSPRPTRLARNKVADAKEEALMLVAERLAEERLWPRLIGGRELETLLGSSPAAAYIREHSPYATDAAYSLAWELSEKDSVFIIDRASSNRKETYRFLHPSFHPFLVARRLSALPFDVAMARIRDHVYFDPEPFWADTSILLGGYAAEPVRYVESLLALPNVLRRPLYLAARALLECPLDERTERLRAEVSQRLARIARAHYNDRGFILRTLARLGSATLGDLDLARLSCALPTILAVADAVPGGAEHVLASESDPRHASTVAVIAASGDAALLRRLILLVEKQTVDHLRERAITRGEARNRMLDLTFGLTYIRAREALAELHTIAKSPERAWFVREAVVLALGQLADATSEPVLAGLLEGSEVPDEVREACASALSGQSTPTAVASLLRIGGDAAAPAGLRAMALRALYGTSAPGVQEILVAAIDDADPDIAIAAAGALHPSNPNMAASVLGELARGSDAGARRNALLEIGTRNVRELADEVITACSDRFESVRLAAFQAAGDLKLVGALPALMTAVREHSQRSRETDRAAAIARAAARALGRIGDRAALETLLAAAHARLEEALIEAVGQFRDAEAMRSILPLFRQFDSWGAAIYSAIAAAPTGSLFDDLLSFADDGTSPPEIGPCLREHVTINRVDELIRHATAATDRNPGHAATAYFSSLEQAARLIQQDAPARWPSFADDAELLTTRWDYEPEAEPR